jgi:hypothetical protein
MTVLETSRAPEGFTANRSAVTRRKTPATSTLEPSNCDLLNAHMKKGSFFTWQSIWSGIQTFKKAIYGVLAMEVISISGKMNGFQITTQGRLLHQT